MRMVSRSSRTKDPMDKFTTAVVAEVLIVVFGDIAAVGKADGGDIATDGKTDGGDIATDGKTDGKLQTPDVLFDCKNRKSESNHNDRILNICSQFDFFHLKKGKVVL